MPPLKPPVLEIPVCRYKITVADATAIATACVSSLASWASSDLAKFGHAAWSGLRPIVHAAEQSALAATHMAMHSLHRAQAVHQVWIRSALHRASVFTRSLKIHECCMERAQTHHACCRAECTGRHPRGYKRPALNASCAPGVDL